MPQYDCLLFFKTFPKAKVVEEFFFQLKPQQLENN